MRLINYDRKGESSRKLPDWQKKSTLVFVAAVIFTLGVLAGRGDLSFRSPASSQAEKLDYSSVSQLYQVLKDSYDGKLDNNELLDGLKDGLAGATGDPYTEYFDSEEAKAFNEQLTGSFTGIGAELGTDDEKNIIIVSPLQGYPAEKAGLKSQDILAAIDGKSTAGSTISAAVKKIRGPEGTKVTLTIIRASGVPFDVEITRAKITVPSVESTIEGDIGYLKISQFSSDTGDLAKEAALNFKSKNVKGVILDLRSNPGGYMDSAVELSGLWLDRGKVVVEQKKGNKVLSRQLAGGGNILNGIPTVVLINNGSASASEITAGALRDHKAATLVGVKSFGKGSVQQVERLSGGAELKVTIARWFTPSGKNIDQQGIEPEIKVENNDEDAAAKRDPQKDRAIQLLRERLR